MRALIIGLGSMGKRRTMLLQKHFSEVALVGIDNNVQRRFSVSAKYNMDTFASIDEALLKGRFDFAFVCTAPIAHSQIINQCLKNSMNVFTEINLIDDGYDDNIALAKDKGRVLFLSSTFLYRDETRFLIDKMVQHKGKLNYTYHVGQYLPDWHPWENFKDFFVGDKRTNACRELFAIELPWLLAAFGKVKNMSVIKGSISSLPLGYADSYLVTFVHETGHSGQLMIDVVTRIPVRSFSVFGENMQVEWKGKPEELWLANDCFSNMEKVNFTEHTQRLEGYRDFIVENAYVEEIREFFLVCSGKSTARYSFSQDKCILSLIDEIEQ